MSDQTRTRLDKWLVYARVVKSRALAVEMIEAGKVRVNKIKVKAGDKQIGPGDVLTISRGNQILVYELLDIGERRGPASEAQQLYRDLSPDPATPPVPGPVGEPTSKIHSFNDPRPVYDKDWKRNR